MIVWTGEVGLEIEVAIGISQEDCKSVTRAFHAVDTSCSGLASVEPDGSVLMADGCTLWLSKLSITGSYYYQSTGSIN